MVDEIAEFRIAFLRELGLIIDDEDFFAETISKYGYHEIFYQYADHFFRETRAGNIKPKRKTTFEELYAFYQLDQKLKNVMMISLQLFEQSFKVALAEEGMLEEAKNQTRNFNSRVKNKHQFLNEKYQLKDGRVIHRGDVKTRIRHIKQNYLKLYEGYTKVHGESNYWVIIKEMSFGVATNYFFLMPLKARKKVLVRVFKEHFTMRQFEE